MTSVASHAAGARRSNTKHTVTVQLTPDDLTMIQAFIAWSEDYPTRSPKKDQIKRGYGVHSFPMYQHGHAVAAASGRKALRADMTGPHTFRRLVALHVIEHSRNGHCWLTPKGRSIAKQLTTAA